MPEINRGQLAFIIKAKFEKKVIQQNKVQGKPFMIHEIVDKIQTILDGQ